MKWKELLGRADVLILDTETTGLRERAEIIEIAVIDTAGRERFHSLCKPQRRVPKSATEINNITNDMVANAKKWKDIHGTIDKLLRKSKYVLAWNADFDEMMLRQTAERYHLRWKAKIRFHDLLRGLPEAAARQDRTIVWRMPVAMKAYQAINIKHTGRRLTVIAFWMSCGHM